MTSIVFCALMWSSRFNTIRDYHSKHELTGAMLTLFIAALGLILLWRRWTAKKLGMATPPLPPGPRGLPLIGYLPFLGTELHQEFAKLASVYGPIYKLWLGSKLCVVISSPGLVKEVVRDHDTVFANHDLTISALVASYGGNDIAFAPYGQQWKKLRKVFVREMLSNTILNNLCGLRREEVHKSIKQIYEKIHTPIDVGNMAFLTVINATTSMLCGTSGHQKAGGGATDIAKIRKAVMQLMVLLGKPNISDLFPSLAWLDLQGVEREAKKVVRVLERFFDSAIQQARNAKAELAKNICDQQKDFLPFLLELHEHGDDSTSISMDQLKALLMDIVIGGTDTATTTMEWAMAELLKHPEKLNKVHEELAQVVGLNNTVEESHLSQLVYLKSVTKETLRLHPPLPILVPRFPSQTTIIGGYKVPKNARVFLNIRSIQRDPSYWENPLEFRPERFMNIDHDHDDNASKFDFSGNNFHFLPFGSGRRVCAGLPLVERMVIYMLASFLHSFEWKLPLGTKLELSDKFGIVVKKLEPLLAIPTPRLCNLELYN